MGDVRVGTEIATPFGHSPVKAIYPQGEQDIYKIQFSGSSFVECTADHSWEVQTNRKNRSGKYRADKVLTTAELMEKSHSELRRLGVPDQGVVEFAERAVPLDPYLVGVLIGDGGLTNTHLGQVRLASADDEILKHVSEALPPNYYLHHVAKYDYRLTRGPKFRGPKHKSPLIQALKDLGLAGLYSHQRFIPDCYLYNTKEVRIAMLQGLLDTDGWVDEHGQARFDQTSTRLAIDVGELVESLGGFVGYSYKVNEHKGCMKTSISHPDAPSLFRLTRKKEKARPRKVAPHRKIQSIEWSHRADTQCISLEDPRGLYLTDGMIATHNTTEYAKALVQRMVREPLRICVARAFRNSIGESNKAAIVAQIKELGYEHFFKVNEDTIDCTKTGAHMFFLGWSRNTVSIRGLEAVDILWIDEGQYLTVLAWEEIEPTVRKDGSEIWISFNPTNSSDIVWVEFCENEPPTSTFLHKVNYTENPFVSAATEASAERARLLYPERYRHVWLGELDDTAGDQKRVIPVNYIDYCLQDIPDLWEFECGEYKYIYEWKRDPIRAGFDVADEGDDDSCFVVRQGPVVLHISKFGRDVDDACDTVYALCKEFNVHTMWYDSIGVGTAATSRFKRMMPCKMVIPVNNSGEVYGGGTKFDERHINKEMFYRRNSQLGWNLHMRAEQTRLSKMKPELCVDPRRQLYIPAGVIDNSIKAEFTQPLWYSRETGHIRIDKKPKGSRGSPDAYDALGLAFAHDIRNGIKFGGEHIIQDRSDLERHLPLARRKIKMAEEERELVGVA